MKAMGEVKLDKFLKYNTETEIINIAAAGNFPFAFWKLPNSNSSNLVINLGGSTEIDDIDLEELQKGFVFAPFESNSKYKNHLIKADLHFQFTDSRLQNTTIDPSFRNSDKLDEFLNHQNNHIPKQGAALFSKDTMPHYEMSESEFEEIVHEAVQNIQSGEFLKVVPSRLKHIEINPGFDFYQYMKALCQQYSDAFVYLVSIPQMGTWLGATPENLISIDSQNVFKTTALAGTQLYEPGMNLAEAAWRQKEIEEQAMVSRYIIECFKKIRLREYEEAGPRTSKAGNLIHLKTDFKVKIDEVNFPQLGSVMLKLLHPTSAVCGTPKETALTFIKEHEKFDRAYFSGYLGPNKIAEETHLFVNLRCMQLLPNNKILLYAGAGVTIDSNPHKEWLETELKMDTLLKVMDLID